VSVHFGIRRTHPRHELPKFRGYGNPNIEKEVLLRDMGQTVYVSGSWKCWGPADQVTDGDDTLHILVETDRFTRMRDRLLEDWLVTLYREIAASSDGGCSPYDYAVLTTEDHSDVIGVVLFTERTATIYHSGPPQ
jgi:hypothetical protein